MYTIHYTLCTTVFRAWNFGCLLQSEAAPCKGSCDVDMVRLYPANDHVHRQGFLLRLRFAPDYAMYTLHCAAASRAWSFGCLVRRLRSSHPPLCNMFAQAVRNTLLYCISRSPLSSVSTAGRFFHSSAAFCTRLCYVHHTLYKLYCASCLEPLQLSQKLHHFAALSLQ